jgi:hypothetical protein
MGTDSKDLFLRLTHYLSSDIIAGLQLDNQTSNLSSSPQPTLNQFGFDLTFFGLGDWQVQTGYRYEHATNSTLADNHILFLQLTYDF